MNRVGIVAQDFDGKFGVNTKYLSLIDQIGGIPVIIPPVSVEDFPKAFMIDSLLLPGGADVDSTRYNDRPFFHQGYQNPFLEYFDRIILPAVLEQGIPVIGICRGLQTLNVHFGGKLHQHLPWHPYSSSRTDFAHEVLTAKNHKFKVNSMHHQAVKVVAKNFKTLATSVGDNYIEAFYDPNRKIAAVQWHPEEIMDDFSINLFEEVIHS